MNIVNVGYDSTNYYIVEAKSGKLLVDCGWPGTLPKFMAELKRKGISFKLIVLEPQIDFITPFAEFFKGKKFPYVPITQNDNLVLKLADSRKFLAGIGLDGEILRTPGHSDDSVTLLLDEGFAFTGDLPPRFMVAEEDHVTQKSWDKIYKHKITRVFPAHGGS